MHPSVRFLSHASVLSLTALFVLGSAAAAQVSHRGTSTATAHSLYGTPPPMDAVAMPLVAPVFLQTDQIDSSITVVNGIIWSAQGTITLRSQSGAVIAKVTPTFAAHSSTALVTLQISRAGDTFVLDGHSAPQ